MVQRGIFILSFLLVLFGCSVQKNKNTKTDALWVKVQTLPVEYQSVDYQLLETRIFRLKSLNELVQLLDSSNAGVLPVPTPNYSILNFKVENSGTMNPVLAKKYPEIKSLKGETENQENVIRCDFNAKNFSAMVKTPKGVYYVVMATKEPSNYYLVFYETEIQNKKQFPYDFND